MVYPIANPEDYLEGNIEVKTRIALSIIFVVGLMVLTGCDSSLRPKTQSGKSVESLTVNSQQSGLSSLIWLAQAKGYFAEQDLDVKINLYESGLQATEALLAGTGDLSTAADLVVARKILERPDIRIIASIDIGNDTKFVARKDRGISRISDIANKKIGLFRNTVADYYLYLVSVLHNIPYRDIEIVDLSPSEQVKAIAKGDIDACIVWEPYATQAKNELGTNGTVQSAQSGYGHFWILVSTVEKIQSKSSAIHRFVHALALAEEFIKDDKGKAEQIVAAQLGSNYTSWEDHDFRLDLDRFLVISMENQLKWKLGNPKTPSGKILPNFLDYIYFDALQKVNPEKVRMMYQVRP